MRSFGDSCDWCNCSHPQSKFLDEFEIEAAWIHSDVSSDQVNLSLGSLSDAIFELVIHELCQKSGEIKNCQFLTVVGFVGHQTQPDELPSAFYLQS